MEVLCVDGKFSSEALAFYEKHGVKTPQEDKIYTPRDAIKHSNGEIGILLEEIINPKVPVKHPILGVVEIEPTWAITRFRNLQGNILSSEEEREILKVKPKVHA